VKQKLAYAAHILRDSSGSNASLLLEGKLEGKKAGGRSQRTWIDDIDT